MTSCRASLVMISSLMRVPPSYGPQATWGRHDGPLPMQKALPSKTLCVPPAPSPNALGGRGDTLHIKPCPDRRAAAVGM